MDCSRYQEMSADKVYELFDEKIFNLTNGFKKPPPLFVKQESKESLVHEHVRQDDSFDEVDSSLPTISKENHRGDTYIIADDVVQTCDTILVGFERATTENILLNGEILCDRLEHTENAKDLKDSIEKNKSLWKDKSTDSTNRINQVDGLLEAIQAEDYDEISKIYYRAQHKHTFNAEDRLLHVPIRIHHSELNKEWVKHINNAIESINTATPGITIYEAQRDIEIEIGVLKNQSSKLVFTVGHIHEKSKPKPFIHLGRDWEPQKMKGTMLHELMHALSFSHEMQRFDISMYLEIDGQKDNINFKIKEDTVLTRFDPFSVMMYSENREMKRKVVDKIWKRKPTLERLDELSELNKVALNLKYKPCKNTIIKDMHYDPKLNEKMQMIYCGREVMLQHNQVGESTTNGYCGPNNWANCASCRVIKFYKPEGENPREIHKLNKCLENGKWQGLSGLFYCGKQDEKFKTDLKKIKSDGICGPDNDIPCTECGKLLFEDYAIARWDSILKT